MLLRIFESPIVDAILIILAIRFIWPGLFGIKKKKSVPSSNRQQQNYVRDHPKEKTSKTPEAQGEYIDYEEIK